MIILDREEIYDPLMQNIWCFKHVDDIVEGVVLNLSIPDDVILVEETTTDPGGSGRIWGCSNRELVEARKTLAKSLTENYANLSKKALAHLVNVETNAIRNIGLFTGQNNIGKILMICRECLKQGTVPKIDLDLLRSKNIHLLGRLVRL